MESEPLDAVLEAVAAGVGEPADANVAGALLAARSERSAEALNQLGTALVRSGRQRLAEKAYRASNAIDPSFLKPLSNLGNLLVSNDPTEAVDWLRRALAVAPDQAKLWLGLGNALTAAGADLARIVEAFERSVELAPSWNAYHNLGAVLLREGHLERGIAALERAVEIDPAAGGSWLSLGESLATSGRRPEAERAFARAGAVVPVDDANLMANVVAHAERHFFDNLGIELAERALDASPLHETLMLLYVFMLERGEQLERGEARFLAAKDAASVPAPLLHLARLRARQRRFDEEAALLEEARRRFPDHLAVLAQAARKLRHEGRLDEAVELLERLALRPDCTVDMLEALANTFLDVGDAKSGFETLQRARALAEHPRHCNLGLLAFVGNAVDGLGAEEIAELHHGFGYLREAAPRLSPKARSYDVDRRLRVGYVSPDFRSHSVALFMEGILREHDRSQVDLVCYSITAKPFDATTERIRSLPLQFRDMHTRNDFELARQIVDDSIDVLVDLTGWTSEQRMQSFIMRPAPVLVTYLGYPNTTGLEEIDYRITDRRADPPGADALYAEKLFRLPRCAWGFGLTEKTPSIKDRSADAPIVFGSFNNLRKTTATTLDLWARVLARVPESRLLLKSKQLKHARAKARVMDELSSRGVDPSRVELRSMTLHRYDHLDAYGEMDIALDTFPYNGTTTTCEALYMGVPVVSLQGETPASRVGASLLQAVGLPDLSTTDGDAYVETAVRLSRDRQRVSELRATLRERLRASELGDQRGMARALEDAYRQMWSAWVGSQHP